MNNYELLVFWIYSNHTNLDSESSTATSTTDSLSEPPRYLKEDVLTLQAPDWENSSNSVYTWSRYRLTGFAAAHDRRTFQFPDLLLSSYQQFHECGLQYHPGMGFWRVAVSWFGWDCYREGGREGLTAEVIVAQTNTSSLQITIIAIFVANDFATKIVIIVNFNVLEKNKNYSDDAVSFHIDIR